MALARYIVKRTFQFIPLIVIVVTINFLLIHSASGDPVTMLVGEYGADPQYVALMRQRFGLDQPLYVQYLTYLEHMFQGDLGYSFQYEQPVLNLILARFPYTLMLVLASVAYSTLAGVACGVYASEKPNSPSDTGITALAVAGYSIPVFWLGQVLILIFAVKLGWLPAQGGGGIELSGWAATLDVLKHLVLPAFSLGVAHLALVARLTRSNMLDVLTSDFILTARAKGLSRRTVKYKHALRNALLPIITVTGLRVGYMVSGAVLIETVFSWPGVGLLLYQAVSSLDYPLMLGMVFFISVAVAVIVLVVDLLYAIVDPRIQYE